MLSERTQRALFLIAEGYSAPEITQMLGYKSNNSIYNIASQHNVKIRKAHDRQHEEMRRYKAEGHTMQEVADNFGVSKQTAQMVCKGICIQKARPPKNGYHPQNKGVLQDIENVIRIINERASGFEYAGNYTGSNGHVDLRCKECGCIRTVSWWVVRRKGIKSCPSCERSKRQRQEEERILEKQTIKQEKLLKQERDKRGKAVVKLLKNIVKLHRCPVCGELTTNKKYCSASCSNKAHNAIKDAKRRVLIQNNLIDKDITLDALYQRDKGICHICGEKCDYNDSAYRGKYFIAGRDYPTIDHVIPLVKGGVHSWDNVKLAHLHCNSAKGSMVYG